MASSPANLDRLDEALVRLLDRRVLDVAGKPLEDERVVDEVLVSVTAVLLREALAGRRRRGLTGWHGERRRNARLRCELIQRLEAGDLAEVIRLAAVINARSHLYGADA